MLVKLRCKSCFAKVSADDDVIGQEVNCPSCNARFFIPVPQFGFGKTLGGYEIEQFLGSGAMGEVYMARQISMNRPVALKVIKHDISMDAEVVKRFTYEAQTLARLNHPNIVPAFDAGHTDECYYMAMGYIDGETLEDKLKRKGSVDELELLKISSKVIDALEYAWDEFKLLHRDIKPANIMIDQMGEVRIMDMGIAKNTTEDGGLTQAGLVVGTPFFMSPEQAQASAGIDYKSDVYALAATMYQMITGILPFQGPNVMAILAKKVNSPIIPPHEIKPYVTRETSKFILRLLSYKPDKRFEDFAELRQMMHSCLSAAEKNKEKADNTVKTRHMKISDEVLKAAETKLMAKSQNIRAMKSQTSKRSMALVGFLVVIIGLLVALLAIPTKEPQPEVKQEFEDKPVTEVSNENQKALAEMFSFGSEETAKDIVDIEGTKKFLQNHLKYMIRSKGHLGQPETLKSRGNVSKEKFSGLYVKEGAYYDVSLQSDFHQSFKEEEGFSLFLAFKADVNNTRDGVVFSYGKSDQSFNFRLEAKDSQLFLITRQFENKKSYIKSEKILNNINSHVIFMLSYRAGELLIFRNNKKVFESNNHNGVMNNWLNYPISFGDHLKGPHNFWCGSIYNFAIFNAFADEKTISGLFEILNRKLDKSTKRLIK